MTPGRLLWLLRRDLRRGWAATRHHYFTLPLARQWKCPEYPKTGPVPVHLLTGANDWPMSLWMLASWHYFTGHTWPVVVHDDGTLDADGSEALQRVFPQTRILWRKDTDRKMSATLAQLPGCLAYREQHPLALKIFDVPHYADGRFFLFDSDVLFFAPPGELLSWADSQDDSVWFNEDVAEGSLVSAEEAAGSLGIRLWPRVNSGLIAGLSQAFDPAFCERCLSETRIKEGHFWRIEQTLFALAASQYDKGGLLPASYEVSLEKHARPGVIARHYVGAVRDCFFAEGLARLAPLLCSQTKRATDI